MSPSSTRTAPRQPSRSRRDSEQQVRREASLIWTLPALTQWGATVAVAALVCMGSWYNISGKSDFAKQVPAMNIAIVALVIANAASIGLLLAGRRAVGLRRQALLGEPAAESVAVAAPVAAIPVQGTRATELVGGPGLLHFHRADCSMAQGRHWPAASATDHAREGRTPCGVCQP